MTPKELDALEKMALKATPGPWRYDWGNWEVEKNGDPFHRATIYETNYNCEIRSLFERAHEDGEFIAAANPATILSLIEELRVAKSKNAALAKAIEPPLDMVLKLAKERDVYREALEFYKDAYGNHEYDQLNQDGGFFPYGLNETPIAEDLGRRAREAFETGEK